MASEVDICNMALSTIGSATTITSISPPDGSAAAIHCATFYDTARREALGNGVAWSFAKRRVALTELSNNPSMLWTRAYTLPADCLKPVRVPANAAVDTYDWAYPQGWLRLTEQASADYVIETNATQKTLLTNESDAVLIYLIDQRDTTFWGDVFVAAVSTLLASYIAGPILRGLTGAKTKALLRKEAIQMLAVAAAVDGNQGISETAQHTASSIQARA